MSKRFDNKRLIYLLAGLVTVLALTFIIKIPKENASIKNRIVEFDTSQVSKIILYPRNSNNIPIEFDRSDTQWTVRQGEIVSPTKKNAVPEIFNEVLNLKPQMLAAKSKVNWQEFELTDSLATRIKFLDKNGKTLADLMIGKANYKQVNSPYGGSNVQGTSFVRLYKDKEIYGVEGFLSFYFSGKFNDWRDKTFIYSNPDDITKIEFSYPGDSSFILNKKGNLWYAGNLVADSIKTVNYINSLKKVDGQEIKDGYKSLANPDFQLMIEGNNLLNVSVKCFKISEDEYIFNSSLNPGVYFTSNKKGIFERVIKSKGNFIPG